MGRQLVLLAESLFTEETSIWALFTVGSTVSVQLAGSIKTFSTYSTHEVTIPFMDLYMSVERVLQLINLTTYRTGVLRLAAV